MKKLLRIHGPVWAPSDEGGQGGEGGTSGDAGSGDAGQGGDQGNQGGSSSILDFAGKAGGEGGEGGEGSSDWTAPEELGLPDHLVGLSADETLAKVAKAYKGARTELGQRKQASGDLEGNVPENADGYVIESQGDEDTIAAELNNESAKPMMDAFKAAAHKVGIPDKAFEAFLREGIGTLAEQGIPIGQSDEEIGRINGEAEMAALTEQIGKSEADTIINTISNYGEKLASKGVLQSEEDIAEFTQMVGTARAAQIFHRILVGEMGEKPIPSALGMDGSVTDQEAYAAHARAMAMPEGAERDAALADASMKMQKAFGNQPSSGGKVKSSVL